MMPARVHVGPEGREMTICLQNITADSLPTVCARSKKQLCSARDSAPQLLRENALLHMRRYR